MARYRSGMGDAPLGPADIPRPDVARDPGVTARPVASQLGRVEDNRGQAMAHVAEAERSFAKDMFAVGATFEALYQKRQAAEDGIAVDRGQLLLNQQFEPLVEQSLSSPETGQKDYLKKLDERLAEAQGKVLGDMKEQGYSLSPDGQRKFEHAAMQLRIGAARRAAVTVNNQRVSLLQLRSEENITDIARSAGASGDVDSALERVNGTVDTMSRVLAPDKIDAFRDRANKIVLEAAIDGHIRRGEVDRAQGLVDRFTGFVKPEAGEVPSAIAEAAKERGVDPVVALAISHVETGGKFDPAAKNPNSTASGLFQMTRATALASGLPEDASSAPVADQAKAGAALIADNAAALRRGLGAEPNPTDLYLAHFLGAPTAVRALRADPAAKIGDVMSPDQIAANAGIKQNGKALPDWSVGELYSWAQAKMRGAMAATNGYIEGRTVTAADAAVPLKDVMQLGRTVHNAATAERSRLRVLINDDIASIRATGQPVQINEITTAHILPPGEMVTWRENRDNARAFYDTVSDMGSVDNREIERRVEAAKPQAGEVGFARRQKLYTDIAKTADAHLARRAADPAGSVSDLPPVKEAMAQFDEKKPAESWKAVISARLAAQDQIGIPEYRRSPVSGSDAAALSGALVSKDFERVSGALQIITNLVSQKPDVFAGMKAQKELQETAVTFRHYVDDVGMSAKEAALRFMEAKTPEYQAKKASIKSEDVDKIIKERVKIGDLESAFDSSLGGLAFDPKIGFPSQRAAMYSIYVERFREHYGQTADVNLAKSLAIDELKRTWGVTEVNGSKIVMPYPPEKSAGFARIENASELIAKQAIAAIKAETGQEVGREQLQFRPITGITASAYKSGQQTPYHIFWTDKLGVLHTLNPGRAFVPDAGEALNLVRQGHQAAFEGRRAEDIAQGRRGQALRDTKRRMREEARARIEADRTAAENGAAPALDTGGGM